MPADEVVGRPVEEVTPTRMSRDEAGRVMESLSRGETWAGHFPVQRRDGSEFLAYVITAPIRRHGEFAGAVGVSVDASSRYTAEKRQRAFLRAAPDPIFRLSRTGRYLEYIGPANARLLVPPEAFLERTLRETLPADVADRCAEAIRRALDTEAVVTVEYDLEVSGEWRSYETRIAACADDEVLAIVRDVTAMRRFHDALHARVEERAEQIARLTRRVVAIQEEEWRRIGRALHDEVGQLVTALAMSIAAARTAEPAAGQPLLANAAQLVRRVGEAVHGLSLDLMAPLHDEDLVTALRSHVHSLSQRTTLAIDVAAESIDQLPGDRATAVFRIVQEALNNVVRHARATRASLRLFVAGDALLVEVSDDGIGFEDVATHLESGAGLWGMRQRALLVRGELSVDSAPGAGTRVSLTVPLTGSTQ